MKQILVTSYVDPDLDGVASAVAYAEFLQKNGRDVAVGILGTPHDEARYVLDRFGLEYPPTIVDANGYNEVALVDTSDLKGLQGKIPAEAVIEIIDHRSVHEAEKFSNARVQIEAVGAAATLIAEKFIQGGVKISRASALLLYGAIVSNTLNFKGGITTNRDREAAAWLDGVAELPENFWKDLFIAKSDLSGEKLIERIEGDFAWFVINDKRVGIAQIEMIGARKLIAERGDEIIRALEELRKEMHLDYIFQNTIELEETMSLFITRDFNTQKLLEKVLSIQFFDGVAESSNVIMRKQIVPLLKAELGGGTPSIL